MQKSEEKRKIPRFRRYMTIFPLFFFFFFFFFFCFTSPARLRLGHEWEGSRVEKDQKRGLDGRNRSKRRRFGLFFFFKRNRLQNDVVLACSFKIEMAKTTPFWTHKINKNIRAQPSPLQPDGGRRRRRRRKRKRAYLVRGERLARLSGAFVKGHRLPSGETPEGGVAPP